MRYDVLEVVEELKQEMRRQASPWRTTREAAEYCRRGIGWIRWQTNKGLLKAHKAAPHDHPVYHTDDLDALLRGTISNARGNGNPLPRVGRNGVPSVVGRGLSLKEAQV